jgi:hypothetical protein
MEQIKKQFGIIPIQNFLLTIFRVSLYLHLSKIQYPFIAKVKAEQRPNRGRTEAEHARCSASVRLLFPIHHRSAGNRNRQRKEHVGRNCLDLKLVLDEGVMKSINWLTFTIYRFNAISTTNEF